MRQVNKKYREIYESNRLQIENHSATVLNAKREQCWGRFVQKGFPTQREENYKYTNLKKALNREYTLRFMPQEANLSLDAFFRLVPNIDAYQCAVINDVFSSLSDTDRLPEGVIVDSLRSVAQHQPSLVEKYYGRLSEQHQDAMVDLNGAFAQDGLFVYVPKNVQLERPIQLINCLYASENLMVHSRNLIIVEEGAKAQIVVCDVGLEENKVAFFANRLTEVFVGKNAFYEHYQLESLSATSTNLSTLLIDQEYSSNVLGSVISLHNGQTRNNIEIDLDGENCETTLGGLFYGDKEQVMDNFTSIMHNKPHCHSTELFKHVLGNQSEGGFTGKLYVAKDAQKTEAYQTNKNILLDKNAKAQTRPQLEIYADDVRCSHGATIGQLDDTALFYMRSRGISESEARMLLMNAFLSDVIQLIRIEPLRDQVAEMLRKRLAGESA